MILRTFTLLYNQHSLPPPEPFSFWKTETLYPLNNNSTSSYLSLVHRNSSAFCLDESDDFKTYSWWLNNLGEQWPIQYSAFWDPWPLTIFDPYAIWPTIPCLCPELKKNKQKKKLLDSSWKKKKKKKTKPYISKIVSFKKLACPQILWHCIWYIGLPWWLRW